MFSRIKRLLTSRPVFLTAGLVVVLLAALLVWIGLTTPLSIRLPVPSADGRYFAYFDLVREPSGERPAELHLIVATPRGRQMARIPAETGMILWSSAEHLALVNDRRNQATLIVNAEGRFLVLTRLALTQGTDPRWSRDGMKLAYVRPAPAGDEMAVYDIQQTRNYPVPLPAESHLQHPTVLFWAPGSQELYFLNAEAADVVLERVDITSGNLQVLARGPQEWKNPEIAALKMSPDGTKIYLPRPRNCVIDARTGDTVWPLPADARALWSPWSADGSQLFYSRKTGPSEISAHTFSTETDQILLAHAQSNGFFSVDGGSYFFRVRRVAGDRGILADLREWLEGPSAWQHVEVATQSAQTIRRRDLLPWEQTQDGLILARQSEPLRTHFGLYDPIARVLAEFVIPTAQEDLLRQVRSRSIFLLSVGLYGLLALVVYFKRSESPPVRALYLLSLVLMLLFASMGTAAGGLFYPFTDPYGTKLAGVRPLDWLPAHRFDALMGADAIITFICMILVPPALLHFAIVFPEGNRFLLPRKAWWPLLYGAAFLPLLVIICAPFLPHAPGEDLKPIVAVLGGVTPWAAAVSAALMALIHNYRNPPDRRAKDQVRWVMMAFTVPFLFMIVGGLTLLVSFLLVERRAGQTLPELRALFGTTLLALFCLFPPLAIGYALVAHKLFDIQLLIRRTVRYALVTLVVAGIYLLSVGGLSLAIVGSLAQPSAPVIISSTLLTALIILPVRNRLQVFIDRTFDRARFNLREALQDFSNNLPKILDRRTLQARMDETVRKAMQCGRFFLFVLDRQARKLRPELGQGKGVADFAGVTFDPSEPLCRYLVEGERPFEVEVSPYDPKLVPIFRSAEERLSKLGAAVIFGLARRGEILGLMVLGPKLSEEFFNAEDLELLTAVARQAAVAVENTDLFEEVAHDRELKKELEVASEVQAQLFPTVLPRLSGCQLAGRCVAARSVSGDYYDFLELPERRIGLAICDVSGKGLSASLLMANLQGLLRTQAPTAESPAELIRRINRQLYISSRGAKYCTFFYALYEESGGKLEFVNAGHNPPIVLTNGATRFLEPTGVPLGLFPEVTHETLCAVLEPGALLVLYSDGVTEARNSAGEFYGVDRLVGFVTRAADQDAAGLVEKVLEDVRKFTGAAPVEDDQTMVVLKVLPA